MLYEVITMYLKDKKVDRIVLTTTSSGIMYPIEQLSGGDLYLKNYFWLGEQRPMKKEDVFIVFPDKPREKPGTSSLAAPVQKDSKGKTDTINSQK